MVRGGGWGCRSWRYCRGVFRRNIFLVDVVLVAFLCTVEEINGLYLRFEILQRRLWKFRLRCGFEWSGRTFTRFQRDFPPACSPILKVGAACSFETLRVLSSCRWRHKIHLQLDKSTRMREATSPKTRLLIRWCCWRFRWNNELCSVYKGPNIVEDIRIELEY
jgi:hypothetical protein